MTLCAIQLGMFARQREGAGIVIEDDILPVIGRMADRTIPPKLSVMVIVLRVAGKTILGSAFKNVVPVTGHATYTYMFANKWKCSEVVIELSAQPLCSLMTCSTIFPILSIVNVSCSVTGETIPGRIFVYTVDMTGLACYINMRTCQHETRRVVIELGRKPRGSSMAFLASSAQLAHVCIVLLMTRETIQGRAFKHSIHMALLAGHLYVGTVQFKNGTIVVKG